LSLDAFQPTVIDVAVDPVFAKPVGADGALVSRGQAVVDVVRLVCAELFPALS
jgi:hypothetical protein